MSRDLTRALTKNQLLVHHVLENSTEPLSAYTILDHLREHGIKAPLQIYRALDTLRERGLAHKLESLNAFVACSTHDCQQHAYAGFMICDRCKTVTEFADNKTADHLKSLGSSIKFKPSSMVVELHGECSNCADASPAI